MPANLSTRPLRAALLTAALALAGLVAGCAQPQQSAALYDSSRENTHLDAESQAMAGSRRASPQIQLGFGSAGPEPIDEAAAEAQAAGQEPVQATPRPLAEARSFLGTVPCPAGTTCEAARFMVTLAPSGEWRARTTLLIGNQPTQSFAEQGCWNIIGSQPLRIALVHANQDTAKADLTFTNDNQLRVNAINGVQPMLEHRLTRQADLDGIDELKARPALNC